MEETNKEIKEKQQINIMAFISYIGILCLVPILTKEKDEFVLFHAKQGLILFICEAATWMILSVIPFFFFMISLVGIIWLVLSATKWSSVSLMKAGGGVRLPGLILLPLTVTR